jgi:stage III sporulation protein AA
MQNIVIAPNRLLPGVLDGLLTSALRTEIETVVPPGDRLEEVRLRRGRCASLTVSGRNLRLATVLSGAEMDALLLSLCEGSLYAHGNTLKQGYLALRDGIRVGVCGHLGLVGEQVTGLCEVSSFSIRIPHVPPFVGGEIVALLHELSLTGGVLIFAPPAVGKTTLLRSVTAQLAGGEHPLRVAVVDTRGELAHGLTAPSLLLDVLSGYPKGLGISVATRTLAAELIVCDEIGDMEEAREIVQAHNCGVPLLASAHAAEIGELLVRPGPRLLHEAHCFGAYVRLFRRPEAFDFDYRVWKWKEADAYL